MHNNRRLVWSARPLLVIVLLLCTSTSAQSIHPCEKLKSVLEAGLFEESPHSPDQVRAVIERGDADRCGELVLTISLDQKLSIIVRKGLQMAQFNEIDLVALPGTTVYGMDDEYIGEIRDLTLSSDGQVDAVMIEMIGFRSLRRGARPIIVDVDQLTVLREEGGEELRVYLVSTQEELGQARSLAVQAHELFIDLAEVHASRAFVALDNRYRADFAGFGIVAFRRSPVGSLSKRAKLLCHGFLISIDPVSKLMESGTIPGQQVVTAWPIDGADQASEMNEAAKSKLNTDQVCNDAIVRYDWTEGDDAISEAADFFRARGKNEIAERIASPDQDGPWLLAWAPGVEKGNTHDDVLVLAFDLSYVVTQAQAERVFQAWRVAIEQNPELWAAARIANQTWNSAIIRWANMIGRDLDFYHLMRQ